MVAGADIAHKPVVRMLCRRSGGAKHAHRGSDLGEPIKAGGELRSDAPDADGVR